MQLDNATKRSLAVEASCDPRTIEKVLRGDDVRGLAGHRARAVVARFLAARAVGGGGTSTPTPRRATKGLTQ